MPRLIRPAVLLSSLFAASLACAQPAGAPARFREAVALETDGSVLKQLRTVEDYLSERQWAQAIEILRQVSGEFGATLVSPVPGRYVNVATYCNSLLAGLPPAGLALYRQQSDPQARRWFEEWQARGDEEFLRKIVRQTFVSSYGDDALWMLGETAWERGELSAARYYWEQMLPPSAPALPLRVRYPDTDYGRAAIEARLILCTILEGNLSNAQLELRAFRQQWPHFEGHLAGRTGNLGEILAAVIAEARAWPQPVGTLNVETFAATQARQQLAARAIDVGAPQWRVPLPASRYQTVRPRPALGPQQPLSYYPVVYGNVVLVNSGDGIYAWDLNTGEPAWPVEDQGGALIYPPVLDEPPPPHRSIAGVPRYTMTLHEGRLYAKMGAPVTARARQEYRELASRLVCLDLAAGQGRLVWQADAHEIDRGDSEWWFEGSPVVAQGRAYVVIRRRRPQTELSVACYDAQTGALLWTRHVCATLSQGPDELNRVTHLLLTYSEGRLYLSTDVGAIAALDAREGLLEWVVTYESRGPKTPAELSDQMRVGLTPALCYKGSVFAAPNDSDQVMAFDAETGRMRWSQQMPDRIRHLLGVAQGNLFVSGNSLWALELETGRVVWRLGDRDPEFYGYGRGVLAGELVYWTTRQHLHMVHQRDGSLQRLVPLSTPLIHETGGNLTIAGGYLLVAEPERLVAFCEFSLLKQHLEDQLAATPEDPSAWFRLAGLSETSQSPDEIAAVYRRAIQSAESRGAAALRDLAVNRLHRLSMRWGKAAAKSGQRGEAERHFSTAAALVTDPQRRAPALLRLAGVQAGDAPASAIAIWQQVLTDRDLAMASVGATTAGAIARQELPRLIDAIGSNVAARVDAPLVRRLARGDNSDAATLERICDEFPFSGAANRTLLRLANLARDRGDGAEAARLYRKLLSRGPDTATGASIRSKLKEVANVHRFAPAVDAARNELALPMRFAWRRAVGRAPPVMPAGPALVEDRACVLVQEGATLCCIDLIGGRKRWQKPVDSPPTWAAHFGPQLVLASRLRLLAVSPRDGRTLWEHRLTPVDDGGSLQFARLDDARLGVFDPDRGLEVIDVDLGRPVWSFNRPQGKLGPHWAWSRERFLLQTTAGTTLVLDGATGEVLHRRVNRQTIWQRPPVPIDEESFAVIDSARDLFARSTGDTAVRWVYRDAMSYAHVDPLLLRAGDRLLLVIDGETLSQVSTESGRVEWSTGLGLLPLVDPQRQIALDDEAIYVATAGVLQRRSLADGKLEWETYLGAIRPQWVTALAGDYVLAFPLNVDDDQEITLTYCEAATGRLVQQRQFRGPSDRFAVHPRAATTLVVTGNSIVGFEPLPTRIASAKQSAVRRPSAVEQQVQAAGE